MVGAKDTSSPVEVARVSPTTIRAAPRRCLIERVASGGGALRNRSLRSVSLFEVFEFVEDLTQRALSVLLLHECLRDYERSLLVDEVGGAHTPRDGTIYPIPLSLKVRLYLLQPVQGAHLLWWSLWEWGLGSLLSLLRFLTIVVITSISIVSCVLAIICIKVSFMIVFRVFRFKGSKICREF